MMYEKPVILEVLDAVDAVEGLMQKQAPPTDLSGMTTVAAYASDEA